MRLVLVGGLPGTGTFTVASALADRLGAVQMSSDRLRKELAGLDPQQPATADYGQGLYSAAHTDRTYAALVDRAEDLLAHGESVVLDASWTRAMHRELAVRAAERTSSELVALWCTAPREVAAQRMRERAPDTSDADAHVAAAMAAEADPWPQAHTLFTAGAPERVVNRALSLVGTRR